MAGFPTDRLVVAFLDSPFLGPGVALAGALLGAALIIAWVRRWQRETTTPASEASDQLSRYRALFERGSISKEEYDRLRRTLREGLTGAPAPAPPAQEQAPNPQAPPGPQPPSENGVRPS